MQGCPLDPWADEDFWNMHADTVLKLKWEMTNGPASEDPGACVSDHDPLELKSRRTVTIEVLLDLKQ